MPTNLTIPEIKGNFYGGFPYSIDLNVGTFDSASTLNISVINENGVYSTPRLSYSNPVTISMGSMTFNGYLVEYKKNRSVGQKTLELSYVDCSCLLDKTFVGLHKRHGINKSLNGLYDYKPTLNFKGIESNLKKERENSNLIIVGKEIHPCDKNKNGIIDDQDLASFVDWCDPCQSCPPDKYKHTCPSLNDLEIFDVAYSFDELCDKLDIAIPDIDNIGTVLRTYTGTLRSVLQSWCNEFAMSFYWNFGATNIRGGLVLFDRSVPITINTNIDECTTTEILEGESIRNNFATSTISYYQRAGDNKSYNCTNSEFYTLHALRVRDLMNKENYSDDIDVKIRWRELAICLSYYSSALRDCMWWFNYYGLKNATETKKLVMNKFEALQAGSISKILKPFGNMRILKVIDHADSANFENCKEQLGDAVKIYDKRSSDLKRDINNPSYYFFVAQYDKELLTSQANLDVSLANEFIGNHWIKITSGPGCGGGGASERYGNISVDDPEGGAEWKSATGDSIFADFVKFGHEKGSAIDNFIQENNIALEDAEEGSLLMDVGNGVMREFDLTKSLIYKKRKASWYPHSSEMSNYQDLMKYYQELCWSLVNVSLGGQDADFLSKLDIEYKGRNDVALFVVQEIDENSLPITISEVKNFLEPDKMKVIRGTPQNSDVCLSFSEANQNAKSKDGPILGSYGLVSNNSAWVTFDGFGFMAPVQATELSKVIQDSSFMSDGEIEDGYKVRATSSFNVPICIPKIQQSVVQLSKEIDSSPRHELSFLEISDGDLEVFSPNSCIPSKEAIQSIHEAKSASIAKSKIGPERTSEYQVVGVAPQSIPSIGEGLDSLKIVVSDNGVFTTFALSDKIAKPFSEAVILNQILMSRQFQKASHLTSPKFPVSNAGNIILDK